MSQVADVFEEVEEQLRSARYETIIKKGWPYLAGALVIGVLVTLAVWAWNKNQLAQSAKASEAYQQGLDAVGAGDVKTADARFAAVAQDGPPAYKALALMQQAELRLKERKDAEALTLLDKAAETAAKDSALGDSARLKAVYVAFDNASLADIEKRLEPLVKPGRPYAALAREALAMKRMVSGKTAEARQALSLLAISPDANQGLQGRANVAMGVIDSGQAATLPATAKAAAAVPPETVAQFQQQAAIAAAMAQQQQQQAGQQPGAQSAAPAGAAQ